MIIEDEDNYDKPIISHCNVLSVKNVENISRKNISELENLRKLRMKYEEGFVYPKNISYIFFSRFYVKKFDTITPEEIFVNSPSAKNSIRKITIKLISSNLKLYPIRRRIKSARK